jgi:hypothetical protein
MADEWIKGEYVISTDPARLDIAMIHEYLSGSAYWAMERPIDTVRRSIENSLPFGVYKGPTQIGFARAVTDYATFAWLADVFLLPEFRGPLDTRHKGCARSLCAIWFPAVARARAIHGAHCRLKNSWAD